MNLNTEMRTPWRGMFFCHDKEGHVPHPQLERV